MLVVETRKAYGRRDARLAPLIGSGTFWVDQKSIHSLITPAELESRYLNGLFLQEETPTRQPPPGGGSSSVGLELGD
jgi:hypothetical protein